MGRLFCISQSEYVISKDGASDNFFFNWTGITTPLTGKTGIGLSWRWIHLQNARPIVEKGLMVSLKEKRFTLEGYAYDFWEKKPVWAFGLEVEF